MMQVIHEYMLVKNANKYKYRVKSFFQFSPLLLFLEVTSADSLVFCICGLELFL